MTWKPVGAVAPPNLADTRLSLHWASQLVSAAGTSLLSPTTDYSHTNLGWTDSLGGLVGRPIGERALQVGLVFEAFDLAVVERGAVRSRCPLVGKTLDHGLEWLAQELSVNRERLRLPTHEMPPHPVGEGGAFSTRGTDQRSELAAWFGNAFGLISETVAKEAHASEVRCWPHHFDVASLITLDPGADTEKARSIGVGFSPGDGSYSQPYLYVTPWPYPETKDLPALGPESKWHTEGWTGAVLTAERLLTLPPAERLAAASRALLRAVNACRELHGR